MWISKENKVNSKLFNRIEKFSDRENKLELLTRKTVEKPHIYIGSGTCGLGAGAGKTLRATKAFLYENNIDAEIIEAGCIGLCSSEPILDVQIPGYNRVSFGHITENNVEDLLKSVLSLNIPENYEILGQFESPNKKWENVNLITEHSFFKQQRRVVLKNSGIVNPISIDEYIANGGYNSYLDLMENQKPIEVCDLVEKSGLRGRGGGGFPTGRKWKFAASAESDLKYLICNADEGDPGAFMDRAVIESDPHRLIEGMAIAAYGIGAEEGYVYIRAEYPLAIERLKIALKQAEDFGLLGENINNSGVNFKIKIKTGAGAFVCGEETALIHSIEGKRGMPRPRPPFPAAKGLFGKPTIINNVETLSNLPEIFNIGVETYANIGTKESNGTKVFALSGKIKLTGLVEVPMGTTLHEVIYNIAGGVANDKKFKAVQIGGPSGGCITEANINIPIEYQTLIDAGAMMGSGGLVVMDEDTCMVDVAKFFMDFIQRESCGKCIPCREGTRRMLEILESITHKPVNAEQHEPLERFKGVLQLEKLGQVIKETSLCGLGQTAPNPVLSTLRWFRHEYEEHIFNRTCSAGVCTELRQFVINTDKCTGCTVCKKKCPTNAILGDRKKPHYIIENKCIACGACYDACKFDAIDIIL
jgi:NADH:ubiquinone oxidoreductase subunit F (NADH-binding)/(2Fe-2S) ferredoxin